MKTATKPKTIQVTQHYRVQYPTVWRKWLDQESGWWNIGINRAQPFQLKPIEEYMKDKPF